MDHVPIGRYDVSATGKGFATATTANVETQLNRAVSVNLSLPVGNVSTVVEVTESTALIDTTSAQVQSNFDSRQAIEVPIAGISKTLGTSGIYNLSFIGAGVTSSGGVGQGTGPSVSGQRPENNSFTLDGVDNNDRYVTGPAINVSNEAILQLNVLQNQYSAEFGGGAGGIFNAVVKSGTNAVHGNIYEYFQNRNLNAMDAQNVHAGQTSLPRFDQNRLGATVGGPVIKDKLFYFGNYEYNPTGQAGTARADCICADCSGNYRIKRNQRPEQDQPGHFREVCSGGSRRHERCSGDGEGREYSDRTAGVRFAEF